MVIIGSDHGGLELKEQIKEYFGSGDVKVDDVGTNSEDSCDYPDYAAKVAEKVLQSGDLGIIICGTGIGVSMAANKFKGIRAALCYDEYTARMAREHNDANILCLGGRTTTPEDAQKIIKVFLETKASDEDRHKRRVDKIRDLEMINFK